MLIVNIGESEEMRTLKIKGSRIVLKCEVYNGARTLVSAQETPVSATEALALDEAWRQMSRLPGYRYVTERGRLG